MAISSFDSNGPSDISRRRASTTTTTTTATASFAIALGGRRHSTSSDLSNSSSSPASAWKRATESVVASNGRRRDSRRGSIGHVIIDAMSTATSTRDSIEDLLADSSSSKRSTPETDERRRVQREVDKMIESNTKILRVLEEEAIARTLRRARSTDMPSRRESFSLGQPPGAPVPHPPSPQTGARRASLGTLNREYMEMIKEKETEVMAQHTSNINPVRPGCVQPAAMPMWRGYSVLEKEDHTVRGGTIAVDSADRDASRAARDAKTSTAGGYGSKTVKQEINLAPTHLNFGPRFGRRKSSVSEQLAEGMEEIERARGKLSQRSNEIKQNRRESFSKLLTKPKAPGWMAAERQGYTRDPNHGAQAPSPNAGAAKKKTTRTRLRLPDIKRLLYSRPWYLRSDF